MGIKRLTPKTVFNDLLLSISANTRQKLTKQKNTEESRTYNSTESLFAF